MEQRQTMPSSAVGYWNQAWVAHQAVATRSMHALAGAADAMCLLAQCIERADAEEDDHLRCPPASPATPRPITLLLCQEIQESTQRLISMACAQWHFVIILCEHLH